MDKTVYMMDGFHISDSTGVQVTKLQSNKMSHKGTLPFRVKFMS